MVKKKDSKLRVGSTDDFVLKARNFSLDKDKSESLIFE